MSLNPKKKPAKKVAKKGTGDIVSDAVGNYEKHPFFVKKATTAKAFLSKVGLPKQLAKKAQA